MKIVGCAPLLAEGFIALEAGWSWECFGCLEKNSSLFIDLGPCQHWPELAGENEREASPI
jgi:hypothetical protein